ncbi:MAG: hypothetical protein JXK07_15920 [Spirochaetes bacterium]|nr:hypothetical protein [Spirochaetota bacterium]MBN2770580.1 hypothetical protein [Spirochaetota bacterium]
MNKIILLIILSIPSVGFAAYFTPVDGSYGPAFTPEYINTIVQQMMDVAESFNSDQRILLAGSQDEFAKANNNASASTMLNGSLYTRTEIDNIAVGFGTAAGVVNPSAVSSIEADLNKGKDIGAGGAINGFTVYASADGASFSDSFLKYLLFDAKIGYFSSGSVIDQFSSDSYMFGAGVRYKPFSRINISQNMYMRPVTFGTGVYYVQSSLTVNADNLYKKIHDDLTGIQTEVSTDLQFVVSNSSTTIPIEAVTSFCFLDMFSLIAGTGFDFVFGSTDVDLETDSDISVSHDILPIAPIQMPDLKLHDSKTTENSQMLRYKIITGLGFQLKSFTLDIPVTWYPVDDGYSITIIGAALF